MINTRNKQEHFSSLTRRGQLPSLNEFTACVLSFCPLSPWTATAFQPLQVDETIQEIPKHNHKLEATTMLTDNPWASIMSETGKEKSPLCSQI
jgi:hypothetical protein